MKVKKTFMNKLSFARSPINRVNSLAMRVFHSLVRTRSSWWEYPARSLLQRRRSILAVNTVLGCSLWVICIEDIFQIETSFCCVREWAPRRSRRPPNDLCRLNEESKWRSVEMTCDKSLKQCLQADLLIFVVIRRFDARVGWVKRLDWFSSELTVCVRPTKRSGDITTANIDEFGCRMLTRSDKCVCLCVAKRRWPDKGSLVNKNRLFWKVQRGITHFTVDLVIEGRQWGFVLYRLMHEIHWICEPLAPMFHLAATDDSQTSVY